MTHSTNSNTSDNAPDPGQSGQAICYELPNDAEEHNWSWVNAPKSVPNQYRECMSCNRLDASEWLAEQVTPVSNTSELREALQDPIRKLSIQLTTESIMTGKVPDDLYAYEFELENAIMQLITAHEAASVQAARVDELTSLQHHGSPTQSYVDYSDIEQRLNQLTKEK